MIQHALSSPRAIAPAPMGSGFEARVSRALLAALFLALALLAISLAPARAQAPALPEQQALQEKLSGFRAVVDGVEGALGRDTLRSIDLDDLRNRLDPVRTELSAGVAQLEPLLGELNRRVEEIGPKPAEGATEDPAITSEREHLAARAAELDAVLRQGKLLKVRADQLSDRIISRRRAMFTDQLFARSYSVLDPVLWVSAAAAIPQELRGIGYLLRDWRAYADARVPLFGQLLIALGACLIIAGVFVLRQIFSRPLRRLDLGAGGEPLPRLKACLLSALIAIVRISAAPAATAAVIALLNAFDVMPERVQEIAQGLVIGVIVVAVGNGLLTGALAPSEPRRRVLPLSDEMARLIYNNATICLWIMATAAFLNTLHRALVAPVPLTVANSAMMSIALTLVALRTMRGLVDGTDDEADETVPAKAAEEPSAGGLASLGTLRWIRLPFWVLNAAIIASLVAGYVAFAAFLASRAVIAVVMAGTAYLLIALINAVFVDGIASGPRARHMAKTLGVRPASVELLSVLVAGVLKVVAIVVISIVVIGTFGTSGADIQDLLSRATFGFTIGNSTITIGDVLSALLFLALGIVIARAVQRWFSVAILPKTSFDTGLQNSIATIIGYVGSIAVIAIAMGRLGLNLENVALVAGALSVGIGFGLQSIVSNFVSGLILLAERPIRVGDTIAVKGEEGYVRRISVRATEIETFDRASVLIPNSDLITGLVKNFTHANTTGRVIVGVNVAYDADADEIRDLLVGCACDHPQVLRSPPPRVFLMKFADSYLQFELRCVVANVDYALTVKSDLHFAILERLKAAKIGIPYTPWAIYRGGSLGPPDAADGD